MNTRGPILLARYLALAWCGVIIYASLHPFSGWRDTGISPFAFLEGGWPRYWSAFDLFINVLAYLPLGFFVSLTLHRLPGRWTAPILATLLGGLISFLLETTQNWLPSRIPSNIDLVCNTLGGMLGALFAYALGPRFLARVTAWQHRLIAPLPQAELGLTLLGLWLLIPLSPEILLFGAGDLRQLLGLPPALPFAADRFSQIETLITACNGIAVGLMVRMLIARLSTAYLAVSLFLFLGLLIRTLAAAVLINPANAFAWLSPGAASGFALALLVLACSLFWSPVLRLVLAAITLMAGTVLVNLAPANPYSAAAMATWQQGHFFNFNGLTRLVGILWPFLALPFLLVASRRP